MIKKHLLDQLTDFLVSLGNDSVGSVGLLWIQKKWFL